MLVLLVVIGGNPWPELRWVGGVVGARHGQWPVRST